MQAITNLLVSTTHKSAKLLQRDFYELQMLQNSSRGTSGFCQQSYLRTKTLLQEELQKHTSHLFFADEKISLHDDMSSAILVDPIEGILNLNNALPFFAISIIYLKLTQQGLMPISSVINFPALNEICYAEKGGGGWITGDISANSKGARLRVSGCSSLEQALIVTDDLLMPLHIPNTHIRCFGSAYYNLMLFCAGKADVFYTSSTDSTLQSACSIMIQESGGVITKLEHSCIASNQSLAEKIKLVIN